MNRIYTAVKEDSEEILALYRTFINGAADWNEYYPNKESIEFDLSRNALFVMKNDKGEIIAAISIDEDKEVDELPCWDRGFSPGGEFSRLCVRKDMQNKGIARQMIPDSEALHGRVVHLPRHYRKEIQPKGLFQSAQAIFRYLPR